MKVLLLGATGRTGREVLELALARGHQVSALVVSPEKLSNRFRGSVVKGDSCDPETVAAAIRGCDGLISTLGPRAISKQASSVYPMSARAILQGMQAAGTRRLVVCSAALLFPNLGPRAAILRLILLRSLDAAREMESLIRASEVDWTIARPGRLTDGPRTGAYRIATGMLPRSRLACYRHRRSRFRALTWRNTSCTRSSSAHTYGKSSD